MLRFVMTDTDGKEHILTRPIRLTVRMDEDIPADDLYAVFVYERLGELTLLRLYDDDMLLFVGDVDEQEEELSERGRYLKISARSLASRLLDNEAAPQIYDHPDAVLIFRRHVGRYGIRWQSGENATYYGELPVTKGMSQWAVVKNFCNACFSSSPRVTADGLLRMKDYVDHRKVLFSDTGEGVGYTQLRVTKKRCEELSRINIKISDDDGYRYRMDHTDALARGICRERYLNAVLESTPMTCADTMLQRADSKSFGIRVHCPGRLLDMMGRSASVQNQTLGAFDDLYISAVRYSLDDKGEASTLLLKRRKNRCGSQDM